MKPLPGTVSVWVNVNDGPRRNVAPICHPFGAFHNTPTFPDTDTSSPVWSAVALTIVGSDGPKMVVRKPIRLKAASSEKWEMDTPPPMAIFGVTVNATAPPKVLMSISRLPTSGLSRPSLLVMPASVTT